MDGGVRPIWRRVGAVRRFRIAGPAGYAWCVVALRVSRRNAFAAAAGWVASSAWCGASDAGVDDAAKVLPALARDTGRVFLLYRDLARFLADPDPDRQAALCRALGDRLAPVSAAYGSGLIEYLLDQTAGLGPADAVWAAAADAADVPGQVRDGLRRARSLLKADESADVFLIFSRRFDGRTDGRRIFLGVDRFGTERLRGGVALLTAHEYNHIVRARHASFATVLDAVVAEGLATLCSALAEPGRPPWEYLLFTPTQFAWFTPERLARLWTVLSADRDALDPARRSRYLDGGCPGPHGAPPRSGYELGRRIVQAWLERGVSIATLTRMPADQIWAGSGYAC